MNVLYWWLNVGVREERAARSGSSGGLRVRILEARGS